MIKNYVFLSLSMSLSLALELETDDKFYEKSLILRHLSHDSYTSSRSSYYDPY